MSENEYEIIAHDSAHFHLFLVNLLYRTPHLHKDYEISLVLEGSPLITTPEGTTQLSSGDIFLMNPFHSHEISASQPALILSLQISPMFFFSYYPQIQNTEFDGSFLLHSSDRTACSQIQNQLLQLARCYFQKGEYDALACAVLINQLFLCLLTSQPHHLIPEKEKQVSLKKGTRMRKIMHYIDLHYTEKLLLSDLAEQEELDLYYLSHFFKESFGITFQDYLTKIRCEHARQLLLLTDYSLLDISICCGFSDSKYFNKGFQKQYGCSPKDYRREFHNAHMEQQQKSMLTTQEFLSVSASLVTLEKYLLS